jgi:hypothetical protein
MFAYPQYSRDVKPGKNVKLWDPVTVLGIINTDLGYNRITCNGYAPSQGRRCRNPINQYNRAFIMDTLDAIAYLQPDNPTVLSRLQQIAAPCMCVRWHQDQAASILSKWQQKLQKMSVPRMERRRSAKSAQSFKQEPVESQNLDDLIRDLQQMRSRMAQMQEEINEYRRSSQKSNAEEEVIAIIRQAEEGGRRKREEEERSARRREQTEKQRIEKERMEQDRIKKEREETERLEKERIEKERLEQERKEKERQERLDREKREQEEKERKQREETEWRERIRQRAQKRREDAERIKRESEERERQEWEQLWAKYQEQWSQFRAAPGQALLRDTIPWPVKSGSYKDVKASNVEEFLEKAIPKGDNISKILKKECSKWHSDARQRFPRASELTALDHMSMEMIVRKITGMLNASSGRSSECLG